MIRAHYKPSDEIIQKIEENVKKRYYDGSIGLSDYGSNRWNIVKEIAKEAGIENPERKDIIDFAAVYRYHENKFLDKYLELKYRGGINDDSKKQETK